MSSVIKKLRKLAWIEEIFPVAEELVPLAERAVRRGGMEAARSAIRSFEDNQNHPNTRSTTAAQTPKREEN